MEPQDKSEREARILELLTEVPGPILYVVGLGFSTEVDLCKFNGIVK